MSRVHPELAPLVTAVAAAQQASPAEPDVATMRAEYLALTALLGEPDPVDEVRDITLSCEEKSVRARFYRPARARRPAPCLLWFHGGGWTIGDLNTHDHLCRELANWSECAVVSVDYRLAPENPFPAAVEDAWCAVRAVAQASDELEVDANRLAVGGDSAGGNLAAVCAILARDNAGPALRFQLLAYPVTAIGDRFQSRREFASGYILSRAQMRFFERCYLGDSYDRRDWRVEPLVAEDLSSLPPARIVLAELDMLHDEGLAYAEALKKSGCDVTVDEVSGAVHVFFQLGPIAEVAASTVRRAAEHLREALS